MYRGRGELHLILGGLKMNSEILKHNVPTFQLRQLTWDVLLQPGRSLSTLCTRPLIRGSTKSGLDEHALAVFQGVFCYSIVLCIHTYIGFQRASQVKETLLRIVR